MIEKLIKFKQDLKNIYKDIEKTHTIKKIYHFTSFNALVSILKTKRMWFTDYRYLNDPTEIKYSKKLILQGLLSSPVSSQVNFMNLLISIFEDFDNMYSLYISSFSLSDKLSLWRYYANNGTGFGICFNEKFINISNDDNFTCDKSILCLIEYDRKKCSEIVLKFASVLFELLKTPFTSSEHIEIASIFISHLIPLLPSFKDDSFQDEQELRIYRLEGEGILDSKGNSFFISSEFRASIPLVEYKLPFVSCIRGYKEVVFPDEFSIDCINQILIGPACQFIPARAALIDILEQNGFNSSKIEIIQANVPIQP